MPSRLAAVALAVLVPVSLVACSDDSGGGRSLKVAVNLTSQSRYLHEVGADAERVYGWNRLTGTAQVNTETVQVELLGQVDYRGGSGPFTGFVTLTYPDGSLLGLRVVKGEAKAAADTTDARFSSDLEVVGGTGRWTGISGTGTFTGTRRAALGGAVEATFDLSLSTS